MNYIIEKQVDGRWWVRQEYGLQCAWGPYLTRRGALRRARKLKQRAETPKVRI